MLNPYASPQTPPEDRNSPALYPRPRTVGLLTTLVVLAINCALVALIPVDRFEDADSLITNTYLAINYVALPVLWLINVTIGSPPYTPQRGFIDYFALLWVWGIIGAMMWGIIAALGIRLYRFARKTDR